MSSLRMSLAGSRLETTPSAAFSLDWWARMPHSFQAEGSAGRTRVWLLDPSERLPGEFSMLSISAWPSEGGACSSLPAVLETGAHLQRYCLSARACAGILRRSKKRGRALPTALRQALERVTQGRMNTS